MLSTNQHQITGSVCNDWCHRLLDQSSGITTSSDLSINSNYSPRPGLVLKPKQQNQHWSNRLFTSAASGIKPYDKLVVTRDRKIVYEFEFRTDRSEVMIGSHEMVDVRLSATKIEPFHAKVSCINGKYQIEDMGSVYGTFLNGKKLTPNKVHELANGSLLCIMAFKIRFESMGQQSLKKIRPEVAEYQDVINHHSTQETTLPVPLQLSPTTQPWFKGVTELQVTDIIKETRDVKTFRLVAASATPLLFSYLPGQFVTLLLNIEGKEVQRSYSMSSSPSRPHTLDLTVKRVPGGLVSNWLCVHIKLGDKLKVKGPAGRFSCLHKPSRKVLFIGAGSGITPLMSMSRWLFDTASSVDAKVLFSFRHRKDIIYRKELEMMSDSAKAIDLAVTLTGRHGNSKNWSGFSGRIDSVMLNSFAKDFDDREVFLCGPEAFMIDVKKLLKTMKYPMHRLHCESFNIAPVQMKTQPVDQASESKIKANSTIHTDQQDVLHTITFAKSNKRVQTDGNTNLLLLAESAGIEIDYNCMTGSCGECMIKCVSGHAEMNDDCEIDDHECEQGLILSCCAFARSDLVINL